MPDRPSVPGPNVVAELAFDAPLSESRAAALVEALAVAPGGHVLELGCGWAELLLRVVAAHPGTTGTGVDLDRAALERGTREVARRGLHERVELIRGDATTFEDRADVVICVGSAEGLGRTARALRHLAELVEPGGHALFGDRFWHRPPGAEARAVYGELPVLDGLLAIARSTGLDLVDYDISTEDEWQAYEHALASAAVPARPLHRDAVGFAWLVLRAGG